jgi:hypothetical protein
MRFSHSVQGFSCIGTFILFGMRIANLSSVMRMAALIAFLLLVTRICGGCHTLPKDGIAPLVQLMLRETVSRQFSPVGVAFVDSSKGINLWHK